MIIDRLKQFATLSFQFENEKKSLWKMNNKWAFFSSTCKRLSAVRHHPKTVLIDCIYYELIQKKEQYEEEIKKIINKHRTARRSVRSVLIYSADVPVRQSAGFVFIFGMRGKLDDTSCWPRVFRSFHSRSRKRKNQNLMQMGNSCRRGRAIELKKYRKEMFFR